MQKVSPQYVEMLTAALIHSPLWQKDWIIKLLEGIKRDGDLCGDNILIKERTYLHGSGGVKHIFFFKDPAALHCDRPGRCGFIVRGSSSGLHNYWRDELCVDEEDYEGTNIHFHDTLSAQDMFYYAVLSGSRSMGVRVRVPDRGGASKQWFPDILNWATKGVCVQYRVQD